MGSAADHRSAAGGSDGSDAVNIRLCTVVIIKRGAEFLVGRIPYTTELRWSRSPYDAWKTRRKEAAQAVAHIVGGDLWLFNPIAGQLKEIAK